MTTTKKSATYYLPLAAAIITAAVVVAAPFQQAVAQTDATRLLIRLVGGTAQAGLVNVNVELNDVLVFQDVIDVNRNNIVIPVTIPIAANVAADIDVCAFVFATGEELDCEPVTDIQQNARNTVTLDISQEQ